MERYVIGLYEKAMPAVLTWEEKLSCAHDIGYDFVEISIDETDERLSRLDWSADERRNLLHAMSETGVPLRSMCLSAHRKYPFGSLDPAVRERSLQIMEQAVKLADDLGIRIIQLAGYDVYYEPSTPETVRLFAEGLSQAVEMAATRGVTLGFETMETEFMNTVGKAMHYVDLIQSPYLGVYPDVGNLTNAAVTYGTDVIDDIASGRGHIVAVHLKETVPGVFREVPFCTGHVDFPSTIAAAWDLGVRRYVTEMWDVGKKTWKEDIVFACEHMRELLDAQS